VKPKKKKVLARSSIYKSSVSSLLTRSIQSIQSSPPCKSTSNQTRLPA